MRIMLDKGAYMPVRGHATDAGLDLRTPIAFGIKAGGSAKIDTGVHIEIYEGLVGFLLKEEFENGRETNVHNEDR